MGFLQLIPATKLAALYDTTQRKLILFAEGDAVGATSGINFKRSPGFVGGLQFSLMGWVGPLTGKKQPYQYKQAFAISLPLPHFESGSVNIITANHPKGQNVPVHYTGLPPASGKGGLKAASAADTKALAKDTTTAGAVPGHTQLNVLFKTKFSIRASAKVPTGGSVDISFNPKYVQLTDATVDNGDIVWTFFAAEMGNTQVVVTTYGGIATYVMAHRYDVRIFVL
jgi:hypothetical protein